MSTERPTPDARWVCGLPWNSVQHRCSSRAPHTVSVDGCGWYVPAHRPTPDARPDTDALRADADWLREWALSKVNHTKADRLEEAADWIDAQPVRGDGPGIEELRAALKDLLMEAMRVGNRTGDRNLIVACGMAHNTLRLTAAPPATSGEMVWCPSCGEDITVRPGDKWKVCDTCGCPIRPGETHQSLPSGGCFITPPPATSPEPGRETLRFTFNDDGTCDAETIRRPAPEDPATSPEPDEWVCALPTRWGLFSAEPCPPPCTGPSDTHGAPCGLRPAAFGGGRTPDTPPRTDER